MPLFERLRRWMNTRYGAQNRRRMGIKSPLWLSPSRVEFLESRLMLAAVSELAGDVDGDVDFDANDSFLTHLVKLSGTDAQIDQSKGTNTHSATQIRSNIPT